MPKIKVKETTKASSDGVTIHIYEAGQVYDMPDGLAQVFVDNDWGHEHTAEDDESEQRLEALRAEAKELGIKAFANMKEETLVARIEEAKKQDAD